MLQHRSLAFKLSLAILSGVILIMAAILIHNAIISERLMMQNIEENAHNLCEATANRLDQTFLSAEQLAQTLAVTLEKTPPQETDFARLLPSLLRTAPNSFFGIITAFEPYAFDPRREYFAPYVCRDGQEVKFAVLGDKDYQYHYFDWYSIPRQLRHPVWSEPYFDEGGGNVLMTTYSYPFYRVVNGKRTFTGVVTVDLSLSRLQKIVGGMKLYDHGYGILISRFGRIITHPNVKLTMNHTIFSLAEDAKRPELQGLGEKMIAGQTGFIVYHSLLMNETCRLYFQPLKANGWSLAIVIPERELLAGLHRLEWNLLAIAAVGLIVLLVLVITISYRITRPLKALTAATVEIGHGNLQQKLPKFSGGNEIDQLSAAFGKMQEDLIVHIDNLQKTTVAKEKIESELKIAREIQLSIIPKIFPAFPERKEFSVFALLESAKAVGGDLYDFFFVDDHRLCFAIGDVSGKGVPASLFMAVTQTLLKATAAKDLTTGEIVTRMNRSLARDNEMSMFVTYLVGILDITTGDVEYSNAGHNPPFIVRSQGEIEKLDKIHGMPLGVVDVHVYEASRFRLQPGDLLLLYTDGVTEAMNHHNQLFGEAQLVTELEKVVGSGVKPVVDHVMTSVKAHAAGQEQSDDITILALRFFGPAGESGLVGAKKP